MPEAPGSLQWRGRVTATLQIIFEIFVNIQRNERRLI
jgi:hypothetical protein